MPIRIQHDKVTSTRDCAGLAILPRGCAQIAMSPESHKRRKAFRQALGELVCDSRITLARYPLLDNLHRATNVAAWARDDP
jgi:hypothetical protein